MIKNNIAILLLCIITTAKSAELVLVLPPEKIVRDILRESLYPMLAEEISIAQVLENKPLSPIIIADRSLAMQVFFDVREYTIETWKKKFMLGGWDNERVINRLQASLIIKDGVRQFPSITSFDSCATQKHDFAKESADKVKNYSELARSLQAACTAYNIIQLFIGEGILSYNDKTMIALDEYRNILRSIVQVCMPTTAAKL